MLFKVSNTFISSTLFLTALGLVQSCGKKPEEDEIEEDVESTTTHQPAPTSSTPPASKTTTSSDATPTTAPVAKVFVASSSRFITYYSTSGGKEMGVIDLTQYLASGSVTSLTFDSKDVLLAFADPGAAGEKILRIDLKDNSVTAINSNWYQDATNLNATTVNKIVKWSNSKLMVMKGATSIEGIGYNMDNNIAARLGAPFINTGLTGATTCNLTTIQYGIPLSNAGVTKLLAISSGANARLNIYTGIDSAPSCGASVNYVAGTITANHIPVGAAQLSDGKVYVRYQFTSNPAIVRYDYDGNTLSNPVVVYNDTSFLNTTVSDRELVQLEGMSVLFANWNMDQIMKLNVSTGDVSVFIRNGYTDNVNAIAIRPD